MEDLEKEADKAGRLLGRLQAEHAQPDHHSESDRRRSRRHTRHQQRRRAEVLRRAQERDGAAGTHSPERDSRRPENCRLDPLQHPQPPTAPQLPPAADTPMPAKQAAEAAALSAPRPRPTICSSRFTTAPASKTLPRNIPTDPPPPMAAISACSSAAQLAKELEDKTFAMKAGEVTDVIRTKQGYVILQGRRSPEAGIPPMKDVAAEDPGCALLPETAAGSPRVSHETA